MLYWDECASADLCEAVPPEQRRYGTELRNCDMRHSTVGFSGTDGNAVWVHDNKIYDNSEGYSTDVFTAPGHPGFPQDSNLLERNNFYSNKFKFLSASVCLGPGHEVPQRNSDRTPCLCRAHIRAPSAGPAGASARWRGSCRS